MKNLLKILLLFLFFGCNKPDSTLYQITYKTTAQGKETTHTDTFTDSAVIVNNYLKYTNRNGNKIVVSSKNEIKIIKIKKLCK